MTQYGLFLKFFWGFLWVGNTWVNFIQDLNIIWSKKWAKWAFFAQTVICICIRNYCYFSWYSSVIGSYFAPFSSLSCQIITYEQLNSMLYNELLLYEWFQEIESKWGANDSNRKMSTILLNFDSLSCHRCYYTVNFSMVYVSIGTKAV